MDKSAIYGISKNGTIGAMNTVDDRLISCSTNNVVGRKSAFDDECARGILAKNSEPYHLTT